MTKKSDLALKGMRWIGDAEGATIFGKALANKLGISTHWLPQAISSLVKAGWVSSTPGPRGGYRFILSLSDVSVLEVREAIEGSIEDQGCVQRGIPCPKSISALTRAVAESERSDAPGALRRDHRSQRQTLRGIDLSTRPVN